MPVFDTENRPLVPKMTVLFRSDPARNIDRFYVIDIMTSLFGEWMVLREWRLARYRAAPTAYRRREDGAAPVEVRAAPA
jgi:hypothetical protein